MLLLCPLSPLPRAPSACRCLPQDWEGMDCFYDGNSENWKVRLGRGLPRRGLDE